MVVYVVFGGTLATTWVQIIKAVLLMSGSAFLTVLVLREYQFDIGKFFASLAAVPLDRAAWRKDRPGFSYAWADF
jgi:cation/acetate symporter